MSEKSEQSQAAKEAEDARRARDRMVEQLARDLNIGLETGIR